jgi:hypothetical protein
VKRLAAAVVSGALVAATLSPVLRAPWQDGFPLSTYPMFAFARPTQLTMEYALGVTEAGEPRSLKPHLLGTGEVLQAYTVIATAKANHQLPTLCRQIAARVAEDEEFDGVAFVRIVSGTHDAVEYLVRHHQGRETELTRCPVPR